METSGPLEFDDHMTAMVKAYMASMSTFGKDAVESWRKMHNTKPGRWPDGNYQECLSSLDSKYCRLEPARKFGESLHTHLRIDNGLRKISGNRLKISGVVQEIVLGNIIQKFIDELGKGDEYLVLHDQLLLHSGKRYHRCDLAIVRKVQDAEDEVESYRGSVVLFIECKSNLNKKIIFEKFYKDTERGSSGNTSSVNACIVAREPDGNLRNLYGRDQRDDGLKKVFKKNDPSIWINATSQGLEIGNNYTKNEHIPVFFVPDGGGMYRLFSSVREKDPKGNKEHDCDLLERVKPKMPWFGISAVLHYVYSCLDDDGAFPPGSWETLPN